MNRGHEDSEVEPPPEGQHEPKLWVPLYLYLGAVLIYGLSEVGGDLEKKMPAHTAWLFVPAVLYVAVGALARGKVPLRGEAIDRHESPKAFWGLVSVYFTIALVLALMGFGVLSKI